MNDKSFSLKHFPSAGILLNFKITGNVKRDSNIFSISYSLVGAMAEIVIPPPADMLSRKNNLWEETCFECFLGLINSEQYWEFNLSPAGHWNVYRFKAYRKGMQEEPAFTSLPFSVVRKPDALLLSLKFDLGKIAPADQALKVGASAVIKSIDGKASFWALTHPAPQPDFHQRNSFIVELR